MNTKVHKDFHGALSCAFQFLEERYGKKDLQKFLERVGENCYLNLINEVKSNGLLALEEYWRRIFTLEEGIFEVERNNDSLTLKVKRCPAITHLKEVGYPIYKDFCIQTRIVNNIIARETNLICSVESNQEEACCIQKFWRAK
ncbi:MAG: hypothetical protein N2380_04470 [bacterium]|nr:hypothetical protein [bacterium]